MTIIEESPQLLGAVETALAEHAVFGDSSYIFDRLRMALAGRLERMSGRLPAAADLLAALHESDDLRALDDVLGDTVVRCSILHAHTQLETGAAYGLPLPECAAVFAATARRLREGRLGTPLDDGSLPRLGSLPGQPRVWTDEHPNDVFGRSFRYLLQQRYEALPVTPTADELAALSAGVGLLHELLPTLASSALRHAHVVAVVPSAGGWKNAASSSQFHLGGTVFLGRMLDNPWWVAEHLFHEAMHQKLYDFRHAHSLLELEDDADRTVRSLWNPPRLNKSNDWDVHRVIAAFHVYVHVALLAIVAERRAGQLTDTYGAFRGMIESRRALDRAHYLGEKLVEQCWDRLGLAGQRITEWLLATLDFLDATPPPRGATVHLCLDLYEREAGQVAAAMAEPVPVPSVSPERLTPLAEDELRTVRRVVAAVGAQAQLRQIDALAARYQGSELGAHFPEVRRTLATALTDASVDRCRISGSGEQDDIVRELVENESRRVYALLAGYPDAVVDAKRRERELRFTQSCQDPVGRLLTVLAGVVPGGGRILEIGTGAGVGTAWLTAGLGERSDVEVVSVEVDERLSAATRAWPWPGHVRFVTGDATELLGSLGTFDLVFADAAPVKYGHLDTVLATLRPGGVLLVDDLAPGGRTSAAKQAEKDLLRAQLLRNPRLHAVEIDSEPGMILASRPRRPA